MRPIDSPLRKFAKIEIRLTLLDTATSNKRALKITMVKRSYRRMTSLRCGKLVFQVVWLYRVKSDNQSKHSFIRSQMARNWRLDCFGLRSKILLVASGTTLALSGKGGKNTLYVCVWNAFVLQAPARLNPWCRLLLASREVLQESKAHTAHGTPLHGELFRVQWKRTSAQRHHLTPIVLSGDTGCRLLVNYCMINSSIQWSWSNAHHTGSWSRDWHLHWYYLRWVTSVSSECEVTL